MKIALSPSADRALRFRDRGVDVLQRDGRGREQAVGRERAVLRDPVVVGAVAVEHERGIAHRFDRVERPEREREARVEHRRVDAFVVEGLDARRGVPRARVPSVYFQSRASSSSASKPAEHPKIAEPAARRTPPMYHESLPSVSSAM